MRTLFNIKSRIKSPEKIMFFIILYLKKTLKYSFKPKKALNSEIDLVIVTIDKDFNNLKLCINSARQNIQHEIKNIYIVSRQDSNVLDFCKENNFNFINENDLLGYGKKNIHYNCNGVNRSGWIFQQLLKLSSDKFTKSENFLVLDSDTILLNKHTFINLHQNFVFFQSDEWNEEYFKTYKKIFNRKPKAKLSFVSHMMIINKKILHEFKREIEKIHNKNWDRVILDLINPNNASYFSEYETYGNWIIEKYPEKVKLVPFYNLSTNRQNMYNYIELQNKFSNKYNSVSFHNHANN